MDIQLFATDEELQDFPETKTDSTVPDKTSKSNSINLTASDLPRSHTDLPKIPSRLPERKSKRKSRREHRRKIRSGTRSKNPNAHRQVTSAKNPVHRQADTSEHPTVDRQPALARKLNVYRQSAQPNDQLEFKQEIQWIGKPIPAAYLSQLVDRSVDPPPSEAVLPGQPALGSPEIDPLLARQPILRPPVPCQSCGAPAQSSGPTVVVSPPPAQLERARSNPLTPGTPIRPPRYPDRPEPIKLNYNSLEKWLKPLMAQL